MTGLRDDSKDKRYTVMALKEETEVSERRFDAGWNAWQREEEWFDNLEEKRLASYKSDVMTCSTQVSEIEPHFSGGSGFSGCGK